MIIAEFHRSRTFNLENKHNPCHIVINNPKHIETNQKYMILLQK